MWWQEIGSNKTLWVVILSGVIAQSIKVAGALVKGKKFSFSWLVHTGGMPSAHSAAVVSFTVCIGKATGFSSPFFALAVLFALITMFDAQTWRRSIGFQAKILNRMMEDIQENKKIGEDRLRELVGHTPIEVFMGVLIGLVTALTFYR